MTIATFDETGLPDQGHLREAYELTKEVLKTQPDEIVDEYVNAAVAYCLSDVFQITDIDEDRKIKWSIMLLLSMIGECGGELSENLDQRVRELVESAGIPDYMTGDTTYNMDMDISGYPEDLQALSALGIAGSIENILSGEETCYDKNPELLNWLKDCFNQQSKSIRENVVPPSVYQRMNDAVKRFNAYKPK